MTIDTDQIDEVLAALAAADSVDATGIRVETDNDVVVLRGAVATFEESTAAEQAAQERAETVRNELVVDHNLRETGGMEPTSDDGAESSRRDGLRGSSFDPLEQANDVVTDVQESLDENVAWDPPHESVEVPTRAEARGLAPRGAGITDEDPDTELDEEPASTGKSLPDMAPEELARAAQPRPAEEDRS
jgi:hypothetical protein